MIDEYSYVARGFAPLLPFLSLSLALFDEMRDEYTAMSNGARVVEVWVCVLSLSLTLCEELVDA